MKAQPVTTKPLSVKLVSEHSIYTPDCIYKYVYFYMLALESIYLSILDNIASTGFCNFGTLGAVTL